MKKDNIYFEVTYEQWKEFVQSSCLRGELMKNDNNDYVNGYVRGTTAALKDLIWLVKGASDEFYNDLEVIENRIRKGTCL